MNSEKSVGRMIGILSNQIKRQFDDSTSKNGLTPVQGRILYFIYKNWESKDVFQRDIENEFNLRRPTATGILQLMEKNGMISRDVVTYDARLKKITLTEKAINIQGLVSQCIEDLEERLTKDISEDELKVFFTVMNKISQNLDNTK